MNNAHFDITSPNSLVTQTSTERTLVPAAKKQIQNTSNNLFTKDIALSIFAFLDANSLARMQCVCKNGVPDKAWELLCKSFNLNARFSGANTHKKRFLANAYACQELYNIIGKQSNPFRAPLKIKINIPMLLEFIPPLNRFHSKEPYTFEEASVIRETGSGLDYLMLAALGERKPIDIFDEDDDEIEIVNFPTPDIDMAMKLDATSVGLLSLDPERVMDHKKRLTVLLEAAHKGDYNSLEIYLDKGDLTKENLLELQQLGYELDPDDPPIAPIVFRLAILETDPVKKLNMLDNAIEMYGKNIPGFVLGGIAIEKYKLKKYAEADKLFNQALAKDYNTCRDFHVQHAIRNAYEWGQYSKGEAYFDKISPAIRASIQPKLEKYKDNKSRNPAEQISHHISRTEIFTIYYGGKIKFALGKYDEARELFELAQELYEGRKINFYFELGATYHALGQIDNAEKFLDKALKDSGEKPCTELLWRSARVKLRKQNFAAAEILMDKYLVKVKGKADSINLLKASQIKFALKKYSEGIQLFDAAFKRNPKRIGIRFIEQAAKVKLYLNNIEGAKVLVFYMRNKP